MTVQTLYASAVSINNGLLSPQNALGSTTSDFTTNTDNASWDATFDMQDPVVDKLPSGDHTFKVRARKDPGTNSPTLTIEILSATGSVIGMQSPTVTSVDPTFQDFTIIVPSSAIRVISGEAAANGLKVRLTGSATGGGPSARSTVQISFISWTGDFISPSAPPVANAGPDQTVAVNSLVTLDGSASSDDVGISHCQWFLNSSPEMVNIADPTSLVTTFTPPVAGNYLFSLIVYDAEGQSHSDNMVVYVNAAPTGISFAWHTQGGGDAPVTGLLWHNQGDPVDQFASADWHNQA